MTNLPASSDSVVFVEAISTQYATLPVGVKLIALVDHRAGAGNSLNRLFRARA
jgi:hypothetical protein